MRTRTLMLGACLVFAACDDSTGPTGSGSLVVSVSTTGGDHDLDGYDLEVDRALSVRIAISSTQELTLDAGRHLVELAGVAANCAVQGESAKEVLVVDGQSVDVRFAVGCSATGVTVRTSTVGLDPDPTGYQLLLDGVPSRTMGATASTVLSRLAPGPHVLELTGIAPTCDADGPTVRTVTVVNAELALVEFPLTCRAAWGAIRVQASTTGSDLDGEYRASVAGFPGLTAPVNGGSGVILQVPAGTHQVQLEDVASNCTAPGGASREATVTVGGTVRDTADVVFAVECLSDRGTIRVTIATSGSTATGPHTVYLWYYDCYYCSSVDARVTDASGNGTVEFTPRSGNYTVTVFPAEACSEATGGSSGPHAVTTGAELEIRFEVTCGPPLLRVTAPTTGTNPDTEYTVTLWYFDYWWYGYDVPIDLGVLEANGTLTAEAPRAGWFWVSLGGVAGNCTVQVANPTAEFYLPHGTTRDVVFPVTCEP